MLNVTREKKPIPEIYNYRHVANITCECGWNTKYHFEHPIDDGICGDCPLCGSMAMTLKYELKENKQEAA